MEAYFAEVFKIDQQIVAGRNIAIETLNKLLLNAGIDSNLFRFKIYRPGIKPDQEVILDASGRTLARIPTEWLQDAPTGSGIRAKLEARLSSALIAHLC
jgi:hypothetical protein